MPDATQNLKLKITTDVSGSKNPFTELRSAISLVEKGLRTVRQVWDQTVVAVIDYNKEIKDASESTGMAAEELSRFIQVGDDMGVEMGKITKALEMGTKNGFAPSIDALADLADKGNAMASTTERAAMYTKIFGRNWAELNPILELGGKRIKELAAAQLDGLVVTEEEIRKSEDARLALDELNDQWLALRNTIVMAVIPAITELAQAETIGAAGAEYRRKRILELAGAIKLVDRNIEGDLIPTLENLGGELEDVSADMYLLKAAEAMLAGDTALADSLMARWREAERLARAIERIKALLEGGFKGIAFDVAQGVAGGAPGGTWTGSTTASATSLAKRALGVAGGGRAFGGDVSGGGSYLVGEHGAERFTPGVGGSVSSARDPLVQEIRRMVRTLPVILRDAVQKA